MADAETIGGGKVTETWYKPGRYYWRGPKRGTEDADYIPTTAPRCSRHDLIPGLDPRFSICSEHCGMARGPMGLAQARAIAETVRIKPAHTTNDIERALLALADEVQGGTA